MRVFIYEYLSATGLGSIGAESSSLGTEGWAMLSALVEDFAQVPELKAFTLIHERCAQQGAAQVQAEVFCCRRNDESACFRRLAGAADYTVVIAPEIDGLLERRCRWVQEAGGRLLGSAPEVVRLAADKWQLAQHLHERAIPTPLTVRRTKQPPPTALPLVIKPRHGAGSQATFLVRHAEELPARLARAEELAAPDEILFQRFVPGAPASAAFLIGPRQQVALLPAAQHLTEDGRFGYRGGALPLREPFAGRAIRLAQRAIGAIPGLRGYVGVDLVLGPAEDGSQDWVIEINPRLTTSYVGLRRLAETNLAEAMLHLARGETIADLRWQAGAVEFHADGTFVRLPLPLPVRS